MNNRSLLPDLMLGGFAEVTPALLCEMGIRALVCDIDNTLVTYDDPQPTEPLMEWFSEMARAGVKIAFVSNNDEARVEGFNRQLGYVAFADAGKPHPKKIKLAIERMGVDRAECAMLGDQVFTDVLAGRMAGIRCLLVPPIKDKKTLLFRFKRALEVPILKRYRRLEARKKGDR
ncbi:MAG: YqeG family HAD IIIA-type phosphatase [Clostridia bacterium]|nr:YqeG family HAD IIIA-type phosphatase [Clostridia bacterium]